MHFDPIVIKLLVVLTSLLFSGSLLVDASIHTVFTTECSPYFTWQSIGFMSSYRSTGQEGNVTRLMSCEEESLRLWEDDGIMPTHIAPSWTKHPRTGDLYSGINKPVAVQDWLVKTNPKEEYILILDADMIMLKPFDPVKMGVAPGWAVSAFYGYLQGVSNDLALKHVPHVSPRNDTLAGPLGRRGDQVGGFTMMRTEDLRKVLPKWISYTEDVRADPDAWNTSGDAYTKQPGEKPWIAEMYGYSFGAAASDVWHKTDYTAMLYPSYMPYSMADVPNVLHYGLLFEIKEAGYRFDKHWYSNFDALQCPPWEEVASGTLPKNGLFPFPPHPSSLTTQGEALLRDLLSVQVIATLNEALCDNYKRKCQPSSQLKEKCAEVSNVYQAVLDSRKKLKDEATQADCQDTEARCTEWASKGECGLNPNFMLRACKAACGLCSPMPPKVGGGKGSGEVQHAGILEQGSGSQKEQSLDAAPATERQTSRSTQQADTDAENAELHTPKLLHGAGHAPPDSAGAVTSGSMAGHEQRVLQSPSRKTGAGGSPGSQGFGGVSTDQTAVDAEAAALQLPDVAKAAQQVRVDEESAQLQRPETAEVVRQAETDAESAQLQMQGAGRGGERPLLQGGSGGTVQKPKRIAVKGAAPLTGYQKFLAEMAEVREQQQVQRMERLCTGNPTYSLSEVKDCLAAMEDGKEWHPVRAPAARSRILQVEATLPEQAPEEGKVGGARQRLGSWLFGTRRGHACLLLLVFGLIVLPRLRQRKQSPLLKVYRHD